MKEETKLELMRISKINPDSYALTGLLAVFTSEFVDYFNVFYFNNSFWLTVVILQLFSLFAFLVMIISIFSLKSLSETALKINLNLYKKT